MKTLMLNQKSGLFFDDIETYVTNLKTYQNDFIIFPSSIYSKYFIENGFNVGIQNIAENSKNNQTGEITAKQANQIGIKYTIIGHSERRINQKENKNILINKFNEAISNNLNIIYCVGESLVDYKLKNTENFILNELNEVLSNIKLDKNIKLFIAYEPIWAIGTGLTPSSFEISKVAKKIKKYLNDNGFENVLVLYGGSVSDENIETLLNINEIDGFLVGAASNDYKKTINMCEKIINSTQS